MIDGQVLCLSLEFDFPIIAEQMWHISCVLRPVQKNGGVVDRLCSLSGFVLVWSAFDRRKPFAFGPRPRE